MSKSNIYKLHDGYTLWRGKWYSNTYPGVCGNIKIVLKVDSEFQIDDIVYIIFSFGSVIRIPIQLEDNKIPFRISDNHKIEYNLRLVSNDNIKGTYTSIDPQDNGEIDINLTNKKELNLSPRGMEMIQFLSKNI